MKKFLYKLVFFSGSVLLVAILLQLFISWRIKDKNLRGTDNLHEKSINADLVLLGSSRAWAHFDPRFFKNSFGVKTVNIAVNGHSEIELATLRLENYLSKNKAPHFAVFNFDPFVNSDKTNAADNFVTKNDYARYAFFPDSRDLPILSYFKFTWAEKYVPLYSVFKYKGLKDVFFPVKPNHYLAFGYENNDEHWDTIARPVTAVMKKHYFKPADIPKIENALKDFKNLCAQNNIKLICIQTPVYKVAYDLDVFSETKAICRRLDIRFVDADLELIRNDVNNFYNSNHMNRQGVETMNDWLQKNDEMKRFFAVPPR